MKLIGADDAALVNQSQIAEYRSLLLKLPKNYGKDPKDFDRSLKELLEVAKTLPSDKVGRQGSTLNRHLTQLKRTGRDRTAEYRARLNASGEPPHYLVANAFFDAVIRARFGGEGALPTRLCFGLQYCPREPGDRRPKFESRLTPARSLRESSRRRSSSGPVATRGG